MYSYFYILLKLSDKYYSTAAAVADDQQLLKVGQFSFKNNNSHNTLACKNDYTLFIGQFKRDSEEPIKPLPCVIRRYRTKEVNNEKIHRELKALRLPINLHENFIQYFNHVATDDKYT